MKIKILSNSTKDWAKRLYPEVKRYLEKRGYGIGKGRCGATVVIGGDGTIIYNKKWIEGILIGIGSKRSGICQISRNNWKSMDKILDSRPETVNMLKARINGKEYSAINEIVVRNRDFRAIHTTVKCGNKTLKFFGDGILVCTRIGSTAYNRSLLGPRLMENKMCITPIAEIGKNRKSIVIGYCDVEINVLERACCIIDGNEIMDIGNKIIIGEGSPILYGKALFLQKEKRLRKRN
jgi:NAD kinase